MRFCQVCNYYLYLAASGDGNSLVLQCRHCGYSEAMEPTKAEDALVLETTFKATGTSAGLGASGVTVNSYTRHDPTLPHTDTLECPNSTCASNKDISKRDVIYIKTDSAALKFQYICTQCDKQWHT